MCKVPSKSYNSLVNVETQLSESVSKTLTIRCSYDLIKINFPQQCKVHTEMSANIYSWYYYPTKYQVKSYLIKIYSKSLVHNCSVQTEYLESGEQSSEVGV